MSIKPKRRGTEIGMKIFPGKDGFRYLVFRSGAAFHTFVEVEAKQAARECGAPETGNTRQMWRDIWETR